MDESEYTIFWYHISCPLVQGSSRMLLSFDACFYDFDQIWIDSNCAMCRDLVG